MVHIVGTLKEEYKYFDLLMTFGYHRLMFRLLVRNKFLHIALEKRKEKKRDVRGSITYFCI